jgi:hypothetical protein
MSTLVGEQLKRGKLADWIGFATQDDEKKGDWLRLAAQDLKYIRSQNREIS